MKSLILIGKCCFSDGEGGDGGSDRNIMITNSVVATENAASMTNSVKNGPDDVPSVTIKDGRRAPIAEPTINQQSKIDHLHLLFLPSGLAIEPIAVATSRC